MEFDFRWFIVGVLGLAAITVIGIYFENVEKAKVTIACYEAAKTNPNIKCDQK